MPHLKTIPNIHQKLHYIHFYRLCAMNFSLISIQNKKNNCIFINTMTR